MIDFAQIPACIAQYKGTAYDFIAPNFRGPAALPDSILADKTVEIVVMCHHGIRSAQVSMWLLRQGWQNVFNLQGGINAYALEVDPLVGQY